LIKGLPFHCDQTVWLATSDRSGRRTTK